MKALILEEYGKFRYTEVPTPQPADNEVLIRVKACAVCGSDVHGMDGKTGRRIPPIIMGHEAAGVIEECGANVAGYRTGGRVTFDSTIYCNDCEACQSGNINLCEKRRVLGVSCDEYKLDGAFAEYVAVPAHVLYPLPENLTYEQAAMVEPLSVAYHAATRFAFPPGETAVVVGSGTIGLLLIQVLKSMGALVIAVDIDSDKLELASEAGADFRVNSSEEDAEKRILSMTGEHGAYASFDAVGCTPSLRLCVKSAKAGGKIVLIGNIAPVAELPLQWVVARQQSLFGSCASAGEYPECLNLISEGKVNVDMLISKTAPLSEGHEWINRLYKKERGLNKVVLIP